VIFGFSSFFYSIRIEDYLTQISCRHPNVSQGPDSFSMIKNVFKKFISDYPPKGNSIQAAGKKTKSKPAMPDLAPATGGSIKAVLKIIVLLNQE
jgi:hypothetical protein